MHGLFGQLLGTFQADAFALITLQCIVLSFNAMQHNDGPCTVGLNMHIGGTGVLRGIDANPIAQPAKENRIFWGLVVRVQIAVKALLAGGHPDTPEKRLLYAMNRNFQNGTHIVLCAFGSGDDTKIVRQLCPFFALLGAELGIGRGLGKAKAG